MAKSDDAFGDQLWDTFRKGYPHEIIERSDGLVEVAPSDMYFAEYSQWAAEEQEAIGLARGRVLDVGCGAGRHALHLQTQGLDVVGIDVSPRAIELCRTRGLRQALVCSAHEVHRLKTEPFDTVLMLGNNLALLASRTQAHRLLARLAAMTSESALIVGQVLDPYDTDNALHLGYHRQNRERGRMGGQIRMRVRHHRLIGPWFDYLFLSRPELRNLLDGTAWQIARIIGEGAHYIAVLRKRSTV